MHSWNGICQDKCICASSIPETLGKEGRQEGRQGRHILGTTRGTSPTKTTAPSDNRIRPCYTGAGPQVCSITHGTGIINPAGRLAARRHTLHVPSAFAKLASFPASWHGPHGEALRAAAALRATPYTHASTHSAGAQQGERRRDMGEGATDTAGYG
jgi:hypothetical protein